MPEELKEASKAAVLAGQEEQAKRFPRIRFIGVTGYPKSSTENSVCGAEHFATSADTESETCKFDVEIKRW